MNTIEGEKTIAVSKISKKCPICLNIEFSTNCAYNNHFADFHKNKDSGGFECKECTKEFKTRRLLILHSQSKCGTINLYKCDICNKDFQSSASLYNHKLRHNGSLNFMCRFCAKLFVTMGQLEIHERIHTRDKPFICDVCSKTFRHRQSLVTHSTLHTGIKPFNCENCKRTFSCIGNLKKHRNTHPDCAKIPLTNHRIQNPVTKLKLRANTPKNCRLKQTQKEKVDENKKKVEIPKNIQIEKEININIETHKRNVEEILSNDDINNEVENAKIPDKDPEVNTTILVPPDIAETQKIENKSGTACIINITCNFCKKNFVTKEECEQHQKKEHPQMLTCTICDKIYTTESSLRIHKKTFHLGIPRKVYKYICPQCGKQFKQKTALTAHEKNKCNTSLIFECEVCNKSFATVYSRKAHMRVHGTKKFLCNYCGKRFHWKAQLKIHERSHTGDKPFSCLYCPKTFAYRESLVTHSSIHTGIKPHLCEACGSRFSCIGNLIKHKSTHASTCGVYHKNKESV